MWIKDRIGPIVVDQWQVISELWSIHVECFMSTASLTERENYMKGTLHIRLDSVSILLILSII